MPFKTTPKVRKCSRKSSKNYYYKKKAEAKAGKKKAREEAKKKAKDDRDAKVRKKKSSGNKTKKNIKNDSCSSNSKKGGNTKNAGVKRHADANAQQLQSSKQHKKKASGEESALDVCTSGAGVGDDINGLGTNSSDDIKQAASLNPFGKSDGNNSSVDIDEESNYPEVPELYDAAHCCDNCKRKHIEEDAESVYYMELYRVHRSWVKCIQSPLRNVTASFIQRC